MRRSGSASTGANFSASAIDGVELARIEIDRDAAARRRCRLDAAARFDRRIAEVGDRQAFDLQYRSRRTSPAPRCCAPRSRQYARWPASSASCDLARPLDPDPGERAIARS